MRLAGILIASAVVAAAAFGTSSAGAQAPMQAGGLAPPSSTSGPPGQPPPNYPQQNYPQQNYPQPNYPQQNMGPGSMQPQPGYGGATQRSYDDGEDSGRGLEFVYFDVSGGAQMAYLGGSDPIVAGEDNGVGFAPAVSVASGVRLLFWTLGPRFRFAHFGHYDLWTLNLDLGWHVPLGKFEPYAVLGGGFAKLNPEAGPPPGVGDVSTSGFDVRLGLGADYYLSNVFSVGGALQGDLIRLSRNAATVPAVNDPMRTADPRYPAYAAGASSFGFTLTASVVAGLHF